MYDRECGYYLNYLLQFTMRLCAYIIRRFGVQAPIMNKSQPSCKLLLSTSVDHE